MSSARLMLWQNAWIKARKRNARPRGGRGGIADLVSETSRTRAYDGAWLRPSKTI